MTAGGDDHELAAVHAWIAARADFFDATRPVLLARAPGRLDVMGGIADYSGSLVLELPLAVATWVAVQSQDAPTLVIESSDRRRGRRAAAARCSDGAAVIDASSSRWRTSSPPRRCRMPRRASACRAIPAGVGRLRGGRAGRAAARASPSAAARSQDPACVPSVPIGKGVSSSAALEVAAFEALASLAGRATIDDRALALAGPEGREPGRGRALRRDGPDDGGVRPARPLARAALPAGRDRRPRRASAFAGAVRHRLGHPPRGVAAPTTAACAPPRSWATASSPTPPGWRRAPSRPAAWPSTIRGSAATWRTSRRTNGAANFATRSRSAMTGPRLSSRATGDRPTRPRRSKPIAPTPCAPRPSTRSSSTTACAASARCWLTARRPTTRAFQLGQLMYESHASYSACGLGSDGTDRLVELVREAGPAGGPLRREDHRRRQRRHRRRPRRAGPPRRDRRRSRAATSRRPAAPRRCSTARRRARARYGAPQLHAPVTAAALLEPAPPVGEAAHPLLHRHLRGVAQLLAPTASRRRASAACRPAARAAPRSSASFRSTSPTRSTSCFSVVVREPPRL